MTKEIKRKIKRILSLIGLYKSKNTWPELSDRKIKKLESRVKIISSIETLATIKETIRKKKKGAYMRFGDGDIFLMLGKDDMLQEATPEMGREMKEAMNLNIGNLQKAMPLHSSLFGYEEGMTYNMHLVPDKDAIKFLSATYQFLNIEKIYTPVALHYLATFNPAICIDFLNFLKSKKPIFVGNENIKPEILKQLFNSCHIKTPSKNSYRELDRIEIELQKRLNSKNNNFQVVVVAMGCAGRILQKRILKSGYNVYLFDFGSLLDAFNGDNTRLWIDLAGGTSELKNILENIE